MTPISTKCPCCGEKIRPASDLQWDAESGRLTGRGVSIYLPRLQARLFGFLWDRRHRGIHYNHFQLMEAVYGDDPDGGPESENIIGVQICHVNRKIGAAGLRIYRGRLIDQKQKVAA